MPGNGSSLSPDKETEGLSVHFAVLVPDGLAVLALDGLALLVAGVLAVQVPGGLAELVPDGTCLTSS